MEDLTYYKKVGAPNCLDNKNKQSLVWDSLIESWYEEGMLILYSDNFTETGVLNT